MWALQAGGLTHCATTPAPSSSLYQNNSLSSKVTANIPFHRRLRAGERGTDQVRAPGLLSDETEVAAGSVWPPTPSTSTHTGTPEGPRASLSAAASQGSRPPGAFPWRVSAGPAVHRGSWEEAKVWGGEVWVGPDKASMGAPQAAIQRLSSRDLRGSGASVFHIQCHLLPEAKLHCRTEDRTSQPPGILRGVSLRAPLPVSVLAP